MQAILREKSMSTCSGINFLHLNSVWLSFHFNVIINEPIGFLYFWH